MRAKTGRRSDEQGKETEHNWAPREKSMVRIRGLLRGQAYSKHPESLIAGLKGGIAEGLSKTVRDVVVGGVAALTISYSASARRWRSKLVRLYRSCRSIWAADLTNSWRVCCRCWARWREFAC